MKKLLYTWLFCAAVFPAILWAQQPQTVRFAHGSEIFPENITTVIGQKPTAEEVINGHYVRYVQLGQLLATEQRKNMVADGFQFLGYLPFATYILAIPENADLRILQDAGARSIISAAPHWKMHKNLKERPLGTWAVHENQVDITLQVHEFISIKDGETLCRNAGFTILETGTQNGRIDVRMDIDEIESAAALPFIHWMELKAAPGEKEDINGRSLHRANLLDSDHPLGKKFNGEGVNVLVRDDGAVGPHIDFQGRLFNQASANDPFAGTHGDGVAGIIGGAGNLDPTKKGMAAGSGVYVIDYVNSFDDETIPLFLDENVTITNSSYSDGCNEGYTFASQNVDDQIYSNPTLIHVFSAGNSNNVDCDYGAGAQWGNITGGHKMAKNAIATANLRADAALEGSSSRGPAYDGRIKPDISAHGAEQNSTDPSNTYQVFGGTSAAAPGIAGCLAQLTQAYRTIHNTPNAPTALLKATLLNTANEMGNIGPDFRFGWGHVNNFKALQLLEENRHLAGNIDDGGVKTHTVNIPSGVKQAKLMIYWVDPAAAPSAAIALINDLDMVVSGPDGTNYLPWLLDPTPDPVILNTPAGKGRDYLNNMEQVAIDNPAEGTYTVKIEGFSVPFGPQDYYLVWEFLTDEIKITYPSGGEGLVSGTSTWLRWDAYGNTEPFTLKYTADGVNYTNITEMPASARMYNWSVPGVVSGDVKIVITRGSQSDTTDFPFSISPLPTNLRLDKVCPTNVTLKWNPISNNTVGYDAFGLGEKYMDLIATAPAGASSITIPIDSPDDEKWFSIRTRNDLGLAGRRTLAIPLPGGLLNCVQPQDLAVLPLLSPRDGALFSCGEASRPVVVPIKNEGLNIATGGTIYYQFENGPIIEENLPDIAPGDTLIFTFSTPIVFSGSGNATIQVGINFAQDFYLNNNTATVNFAINTAFASSVFTNSLESTTLPLGWLVTNPDNYRGWERSFAVVGIGGNSTRAYRLEHFNYLPAEGQEDFFHVVPMNLTNLADPVLLFEYSHAQLNPVTKETLRVEAFVGCDLDQTPIVLWEKSDPELSVITTTDYFEPSSPSHWRKVSIPLNNFIGERIVVRIVAVNGNGNNTYIDNISLKNLPPIAPTAEFSPADTICRNESTIYTAVPSSGGENIYTWNFGSLASPATGTGPGPHSVSYPVPGNKSVRLVVENPFGADTAIQIVHVRSNPISNFTQSQSGLTVNFTNISQNATNYLWNFGDGFTSTEVNPSHTYSAAGTYNVILSAINPCKTTDRTIPVALTNSTVEQTGLESVVILPNPSTGVFQLSVKTAVATAATITLLDASGKIIESKPYVFPYGASTISMGNEKMPAGNYQLNLQTQKGSMMLGVVVVR